MGSSAATMGVRSRRDGVEADTGRAGAKTVHAAHVVVSFVDPLMGTDRRRTYFLARDNAVAVQIDAAAARRLARPQATQRLAVALARRNVPT